MKSNYIIRIRIISGLIFLVALALVSKMYWLQIMHGEEFALKADRQYVSSEYKIFDRGTIFFSTKDGVPISGATLKTGFTLAINPKNIQNAEDVFNKINNIYPLNKDIFITKATKADDPYEEIAKRLDEKTAESIKSLKINGVILTKDKWRVYPGGSMGANILGFVGYKGDELVGRYGLEQFYEDTLARKGDDLYVNFFAQIFANLKNTFNSEQTNEGDIVTTIEPSVQDFLDKKLSEVNNFWKSEYTVGLIMNPTNGEVYAMGMAPTFNPNSYQDEENLFRFSNPLIDGGYELGSIVKALTMASGIDAGVVTPESTFKDEGFVTLDDYTVRNHGLPAQGVVSMQDVLNKSLNTGVYHVVKKLGKDKFKEYFTNFGLGEKTGIDLPGEVAGKISNINTTRDIEFANAAFGQGIAPTGIAMSRALSVLANGGYLVTPHLVKKIDYRVGIGKEVSYSQGKQVISKKASETMTKMLVNVVDVALKNGKVKNPRYSIAAKTGTAQISRPKNLGGGYYDDRYLHSFFGYFPAYNPQFMIFFFTYYPKEVEYASETLTSGFIETVNFLISYYSVPPDR